jgi:hypothetical protein
VPVLSNDERNGIFSDAILNTLSRVTPGPQPSRAAVAESSTVREEYASLRLAPPLCTTNSVRR